MTESKILQLASDNDCEALAVLDPSLVAQARDKYGSTALHYAAGSGAVEVCQFLVVRVDPSVESNNNGRTALHWAARNGHTTICRLLACHIPTDVQAKGQVTPLQLAMWQGHLETCRVLLELGADPHFVNAWGCGVVHWLAKCPNYEWNTDTKSHSLWSCCQWLLDDYGVSFHSPNHHGQTPLHKAAFAGNLPVVEYLVQRYGVLDTAVDHQGNTAADCAERNKQLEMAIWIRRYASPIRIQALEKLQLLDSSSEKVGTSIVSRNIAMPSLVELKAIYHRLAKKWHPDRRNDHHTWNSIQDAYHLLEDWWLNPTIYDTKIRLASRNAALQDYPALLWLPEWHTIASEQGTTRTAMERGKTSEEQLAQFERRLVSLLLTEAHQHTGLSLAQLPKEYQKNWHSIVNPKDYKCRKWVDLLQRFSTIQVFVDPMGVQQPRVFAKISLIQGTAPPDTGILSTVVSHE